MMRQPERVLLLALVAMAASIRTFSQVRPSFEVTSVKRNNSGSAGARIGIRPGGYFFATNVPLKMLVTQAYRILDAQVSGGPNWIDNDRFDLEARAEPGAIPPPSGPPDPRRPDAVALMLQSLLEDRFQLKVRSEMRELPLYNLVVDKGGTKLVATVEGRPGPGGLTPGSARTTPGQGGGIEMMASGVTTTVLANMVSQWVGRPVTAQANLTGPFGFALKWSPRPDPPPATATGEPRSTAASDPAGSPVIHAIQEQLGLKLESAKGPVEVLIIESVQKPMEN